MARFIGIQLTAFALSHAIFWSGYVLFYVSSWLAGGSVADGLVGKIESLAIGVWFANAVLTLPVALADWGDPYRREAEARGDQADRERQAIVDEYIAGADQRRLERNRLSRNCRRSST